MLMLTGKNDFLEKTWRTFPKFGQWSQLIPLKSSCGYFTAPSRFLLEVLFDSLLFNRNYAYELHI